MKRSMCWFGTVIQCLWCISSREETKVILAGKIAGVQAALMALIDITNGRGVINGSVWKMSHIFVPRTFICAQSC